MISKTSKFWGLLETLKRLRVDDPIDELLLLFAWKHLTQEVHAQTIPTLEEVHRGVLSLEQAYSQVGQFLGENYHAFNLSLLWQQVSEEDIKEICRDVSRLSDLELDRFDLLKTCLSLKAEVRKSDGLQIFESDLIDFIIDLVGIQKGTVFAPYDSSLQVTIHCASRCLDVIFSKAHQRTFEEAVRIIAGATNENLEAEYDLDFLFGDKEFVESTAKYSSMILVPPFGASHYADRKKINSEVKLIENAISRCTDTLVVLVPQGVLFRGGESNEFRRDLVIGGLLDAVIQLPTPLLRGTNLALAVLIIKKNSDTRNREVVFVDAASEDFSERKGRGSLAAIKNRQELVDIALRRVNVHSSRSRLVGYGEILENHCDLSVSKYVIGGASERLKEMENFCRLEEFAALIRGQLLKEDESSSSSQEVFFEVGVRDIGEDGIIRHPEKSLRLSGDMISRAEKQKLSPGDILLATKGSVGKVAIVGDDCCKNWVASQSFQIVRVNEFAQNVSSKTLYMFLSSTLVQKYFEEQVTGTTIPVLKTSDIRGLPIPILEEAQREQIESEYDEIRLKWLQVARLKEEIEIAKRKRWALD
ncbi:MAG: N-6 DNA methylase [Pseudohongiellaceae bacterium]|nr:N-6 DNA methylase [Pseudohongiellaceae bacterium]